MDKPENYDLHRHLDKLIESQRLEAYAKGLAEGRRIERHAILHAISTLPENPGSEKRRRRRRTSGEGIRDLATLTEETPDLPPAEPMPSPELTALTPSDTAGLVQGALRELEADHPQGVFPDTVSQFLRDNPPSGNGFEITPHQVRQVLRQQVLTGQVRRMPRGRYLPSIEPQMSPL